MTFDISNQNLAIVGCQQVAATMWLHARKFAGCPAVGRNV